MQRTKTDYDQLLSQPYPAFLELMKTEPVAAMAEFERCARPWLSSHPSASMRPLTAAEQQDVIDQTIRRCLAKDGEPLRNYTDTWGSFGEWLTTVAERTCVANHRPRGPLTRPPHRDGQAPKPGPAQAGGGTAVGKARTASPSKAAVADLQQKIRENIPSARTLLDWFRSPRVLLPVAVISVIVAIRTIHTSRESDRPVTTTSGPIEIAFLSGGESRNQQYDLLDLDNFAGAADDDIPLTAVFRSGRLTVLHLTLDAQEQPPAAERVVVADQKGAVAWDQLIDPEYASDGSVNLRIDTRTLVPGRYVVSVRDPSDAEIFRSAFTVVVQ
ncbi:MAG: hypothetical protein PVF33_01235 [Candidatus Latescibacterota bacterium]